MTPETDVQASLISPIDCFFDKKLVINLERRPDRWQAMSASLRGIGVRAERFLATDGMGAEVRGEYDEFLASPAQSVPRKRRIVTRWGFIFSGDHSARVAYLDHRKKPKRALATIGAWAYLDSVRRALQTALGSDARTALIMDDDCVFHRKSNEIFQGVLEQLPPDWFILQLGTMQWHWWYTRRYSENLYCNGGLSIGSHAVGYSRQAMEEALGLIDQGYAAFDEGALSTLTAGRSQRSFVVLPNIAIQKSHDSDIQSSVHGKHQVARRFRRFRWCAEDYCF
jgi:GR25 family glycosyltransferase involved in LPS biosynthesis